MYWQSSDVTHANNNMLDKWRTVERSVLAIAIRRACRCFTLDSPLLLSHTTGAFSHSTNKKISRNEIIGSIFFLIYLVVVIKMSFGDGDGYFSRAPYLNFAMEKRGSEDKNEPEWGAGEKFIFETITRCKHRST